jgi:hypothetical protein
MFDNHRGHGGRRPTARHALVPLAQTGVGPEGLVVSPDDTRVVATNLERGYLP